MNNAIQISKNKDQLLATHPHFWQTSDKNLAERDGEEVFLLPLKDIIEYVVKHIGDKLAYAAVQNIVGSHGVHTLFHAIEAGERDIAKCFKVGVGENGETNPAIHGSEVYVNPIHFARLIGSPDGQQPADQAAHKAHTTALAALVGLTPNEDRLANEFCAGCGERTKLN